MILRSHNNISSCSEIHLTPAQLKTHSELREIIQWYKKIEAVAFLHNFDRANISQHWCLGVYFHQSEWAETCNRMQNVGGGGKMKALMGGSRRRNYLAVWTVRDRRVAEDNARLFFFQTRPRWWWRCGVTPWSCRFEDVTLGWSWVWPLGPRIPAAWWEGWS